MVRRRRTDRPGQLSLDLAVQFDQFHYRNHFFSGQPHGEKTLSDQHLRSLFAEVLADQSFQLLYLPIGRDKGFTGDGGRCRCRVEYIDKVLGGDHLLLFVLPAKKGTEYIAGAVAEYRPEHGMAQGIEGRDAEQLFRPEDA